MSIKVQATIDMINAYYSEYLNPILDKKWATENNVPTGLEACSFFLGVMLDQMQRAERAWEGGRELAQKLKNEYAPSQRVHFQDIWYSLSRIRINNENSFNRLKEFCSFDEGGEYSGYYAGVNCNDFPKWLVNNAKIIANQYDGVVENIWGGGDDLYIDEICADTADKHSNLEKKFMEFDGIGENLAHMAVFILVRDRGLCREKGVEKCLKIKLDTHVKTVLERTILCSHPEVGTLRDVINTLNSDLDSPANFDNALFTIGKNFCFSDKEPLCKFCPIKDVCNTYNSKN